MKNRKIRNLNGVFKNLFEQEEKDDSEDLFDEEPEESEEPEEEPDADGGEESEPAPEEEETKVSSEDEARLKDSIDSEIEIVLGDFEADARKSAEINLKKDKSQNESLKKVYYRKLWESTAEDIDIQNFASNVARLIKNYSNLLDIETIILNKSYTYIQNLYGEDTMKQLKDVLEQEFDLEVVRNDVEKDLPEAPVAVGARNASGGL